MLIVVLGIVLMPLSCSAVAKPNKVQITEVADDGMVAIVWKKVKKNCTGYEIYGAYGYEGKFKKLETNTTRTEHTFFDNNTPGPEIKKERIAKYKVRAINKYKQKQYFNSKKKKWQNTKPKKKYWKKKKTRKVVKKCYGPFSDIYEHIFEGSLFYEPLKDKTFKDYTGDELKEKVKDCLEYYVKQAGGENEYRGGSLTFVSGAERTAQAVCEWSINQKITEGDPKQKGTGYSDFYNSLHIQTTEGWDMDEYRAGTDYKGDHVEPGQLIPFLTKEYVYPLDKKIDEMAFRMYKDSAKTPFKFMRTIGIGIKGNTICVSLYSKYPAKD